MTITHLADLFARYDAVVMVGDVHGEYDQLAPVVEQAIKYNYGLAFLGDIVDRGPDSARCMKLVTDAVKFGRATIVPGNHDWKFCRYQRGSNVTYNDDFGGTATKRSLDEHPDGSQIAADFANMILRAPLWQVHQNIVMVHGAFAPAMLWTDAPTLQSAITSLGSLALYSLALNCDGEIRRLNDWHDAVPSGYTVYVGHDFAHETVIAHTGDAGGTVINLDTGAGKGGSLSSVTLYGDYALEDPPCLPSFLDASDDPLLTFIVGPSGDWKSNHLAREFDPQSVISTDALRNHFLDGDGDGDQSQNGVMATLARFRALARVLRCKPAVLDAPHLKRKDRLAAYNLLPPGTPIQVIVTDDPPYGGKSNASPGENVPVPNKHERDLFRAELANILAGDGFTNIRVMDRRTILRSP